MALLLMQDLFYIYLILEERKFQKSAYVNTATRDTPIVRAKVKSLLVNQQKLMQ